MQPDLDLFVVARRIAADHDQAHTERLARTGRAASTRGGPRAWLSRHIIGVGSHPGRKATGTERSSTADHPC